MLFSHKHYPKCKYWSIFCMLSVVFWQQDFVFSSEKTFLIFSTFPVLSHHIKPYIHLSCIFVLFIFKIIPASFMLSARSECLIYILICHCVPAKKEVCHDCVILSKNTVLNYMNWSWRLCLAFILKVVRYSSAVPR